MKVKRGQMHCREFQTNVSHKGVADFGRRLNNMNYFYIYTLLTNDIFFFFFLKLKRWCKSAGLDRSRRTKIGWCRWRCSVGVWLRKFALTNSAARDAWCQIARFQCLRQRLGKLSVLFNSGQPIGCSRSVVVATTVSLTLNKWCGSEVLQTRARRHQRLATSFSSRIGVLFF